MRRTAYIFSVLIALAFSSVMFSTALSAQGDQVCGGDKVDLSGEQATYTVTAPDGYLISGYCVKSGSVNQGDGPVYVGVNPSAQTVTISHPSGKAISHYSLTLVSQVAPTATATTGVVNTPTATTGVVNTPTTTTEVVNTPTSTTAPGGPTKAPGDPGSRSEHPTKSAGQPKAASTNAAVTALPSTGQGPDNSGGQGGMLLLISLGAASIAASGVVVLRQRSERS